MTTPNPTKYRPQLRRITDPEKLPPLKIQARDFDLLETIATNRFLTLPLLTRVFPNEAGYHTNLSRRLAKLYHHGLVERIRTRLNAPLIYALTRAGARTLRTERPDVPINETFDYATNNREATPWYIHHALMTAGFRCSLAAALRDHKTGQLDRFEREHNGLRARWKTAGRPFVVAPDAFAILSEQGTRFAFFLEADRETMTLERLNEKYLAYCQLADDDKAQQFFGVPKFRVLTITPRPTRTETLFDLVAGQVAKHSRMQFDPIPRRHRKLFLFLTEADYLDDHRNVLTRSWSCAGFTDGDGGEPDFKTKLALLPTPLAQKKEPRQ